MNTIDILEQAIMDMTSIEKLTIASVMIFLLLFVSYIVYYIDDFRG